MIRLRRRAGNTALLALAASLAACGTTVPERTFQGPTADIEIESHAYWPTYVRQVDVGRCPNPTATLIAALGATDGDIARYMVGTQPEPGPVRTGTTRVEAGSRLHLQTAMGSDLCVVSHSFVPQPGGRYALKFTQFGADRCQVVFQRLVDGRPVPDASMRQIINASYPRELCD